MRGLCGVSRARLLRVPLVCAQPAGGAAALASVPHSHGVFSARTPTPLDFTTHPIPSMTRGKGVNDSRRRRTQSTHNGTRCPPPPLIPCENAYEHADMPPAPPPPPPPLMMRAAPGGHRPPPGFCRPAEGGRPRPFQRPYSPLVRARRHGDRDDCDHQRRQVRYRGDWDSQVFTAALPALCVRIRAAVATTTAGDCPAPLGCPFAPFPVRQGARHSYPTTVVETLGACRLLAPPASRAFRSIHLLAVAGTARAALHACRGLCHRALPQAR